MLNDKKVLEIMKLLINNKAIELEFDYCEEWKFIYINYIRFRYSREKLNEIFELSKKVAKVFNYYNYDVIASFDNIEFIIDKNMNFDKFYDQYQTLQKAYWNYNEDTNCREIIECIIEEKDFVEPSHFYWEKYMSVYYRNLLSQTLYNTYKINQPDPYLDNMVENAKTLIKK